MRVESCVTLPAAAPSPRLGLLTARVTGLTSGARPPACRRSSHALTESPSCLALRANTLRGKFGPAVLDDGKGAAKYVRRPFVMFHLVAASILLSEKRGFDSVPSKRVLPSKARTAAHMASSCALAKLAATDGGTARSTCARVANQAAPAVGRASPLLPGRARCHERHRTRPRPFRLRRKARHSAQRGATRGPNGATAEHYKPPRLFSVCSCRPLVYWRPPDVLRGR